MSQPETDSPGLTALSDIYLRIGDSDLANFGNPKWELLVEESGKILKIVRRYSSDALLDNAALVLANVIDASNHLGKEAAMRISSVTQSQRARAGKKRRTDRRWKHIRCAIVRTCREQKLTMLASASFAESIRSDVVEAARKYGLTDIRSGLSARSIERHIAALIKDSRLLNAIFEECQLQELL